MTIDRMCVPDRFRKRTLDALAGHYGVKQTDAHNSRGDALTAARVVWKQARLFKETFALSLAEMQERQATAHRVWAEDFEAHLRRKGKQETIEREWPIAPLKGAA
jgi:DNA polymerase-3 subunit epsilon